MADRRLRIFHAVAKQGSFTRAAESLFMSQPAVTFQIRQLEERYQVRLFERGHGHIAPVSYTHLDVYKRQEQFVAGRPVNPAAGMGNNLRPPEIGLALAQRFLQQLGFGNVCLLYTSRCV